MDPEGKYGEASTSEYVKAIRYNRAIDEKHQRLCEDARVFTESQEVDVAQLEQIYGNIRTAMIREREPKR